MHLSSSQDLVYLLSPLLTCADVHHMVECVHALNNVHDQIGEANVVLHDERIYRLRLDHVVHQVEPLGVLQAALRQTLIGTFVIYSSTLERRGWGWGVREGYELCCMDTWNVQGRKTARKKYKPNKGLSQPVIALTKSIPQHTVIGSTVSVLNYFLSNFFRGWDLQCDCDVTMATTMDETVQGNKYEMIAVWKLCLGCSLAVDSASAHSEGPEIRAWFVRRFHFFGDVWGRRWFLKYNKWFFKERRYLSSILLWNCHVYIIPHEVMTSPIICRINCSTLCFVISSDTVLRHLRTFLHIVVQFHEPWSRTHSKTFFTEFSLLGKLRASNRGSGY